MSRPHERPEAVRLTSEQVAADPVLREIAAALDSLYTTGHSLDDWLEGSDFQPFSRRQLIADLVDADHTINPDPHDDEGLWLIDRPWSDPAVAAKTPWLDDIGILPAPAVAARA